MMHSDILEIHDIRERLQSDFGMHAENVISIFREAIRKHEYLEDARIIRSIIYLADKDPGKLVDYVNTAIADPRDVLLWAEYRNKGEGTAPVKERDLNKSFYDSELFPE